MFIQDPVAAGKVRQQAGSQVSIHYKTFWRFNTRPGTATVPAAAGTELTIFIRGEHGGRIVP